MVWPRLWWPTRMLEIIKRTTLSIHYRLKSQKKNLEIFGPSAELLGVRLWFDYIFFKHRIIDYQFELY